MSLDIGSLRQMIYKPLGIENGDPQLPVADADLYLNRSFWEVMDKFPFREKEVTATFATQDGVRNYDRPEHTEAVRHLAVVDEYNLHRPLQQRTSDWYERNYDSDDEEKGFPEGYVLEGCIIRLWPTPDDIYTMVIRRLITLTDLSSANNVPSIPQVWHEIIGYGGLWRAYIDFGDFARANQIKAHQISLINSIQPTQAKEEHVNTQYAALEIPDAYRTY